MNDDQARMPGNDTGTGAKRLPAKGTQLIAHVGNDITIPNFTDRLAPLDDTLIQRGGGKGLKLYDEIERDTHAWAVLQKRKHELVAREWIVDSASDEDSDIAVAEFIRDVIRSLAFDRLCLDLLDATLKGFAVSELQWMRDGRHIVPSAITTHDQRRFIFDRDWRPRLLTPAAMLHGEALPDRKFIVHRFNVKGNNPYGLGLGSILFWPVLFKREGYAFWLTFLNKYASPTPLAKTPTMLPKEQRELLTMLERMTQGGAVTVPLGTEVSFIEATRSAPASYEAFARYWDEQISETVLGETLSTNIGSVGSQAAAAVHSEGKSQIIDADGDLLSDTLDRTLIKWLVDLNYPGRARPRLYRQRPKNDEAIAKAAEAAARADQQRLTAMDQIVAAASQMEDEVRMRALIGSFTTTAHLDEDVIEGLVRLARRMAGEPQASPPTTPEPVDDPAA